MIRPISRPLLLALLLTTTACAQAQNTTAPVAAPHSSQAGMDRPPPDDRRGPPMDEIAKTLGLQPKQREALEAVLKQRHEAMRAQREQMRAQMEQMRRKRDEIDAQYDARVAKVLTPEQFAKLKAWEKEHRPHRGWHDKDGRDGRRPRGEDGPPDDADRP